MGKIGRADRTGDETEPLSVVGGDLLRVGPDKLLLPELELAGHEVISIISGQIEQVNDELVALCETRHCSTTHG